MKRDQVLATFDTYRQLEEGGLVPVEVLQKTIREALDSGKIKLLTPAAFEKAASELFEFAKRYGLVKESSAEAGGNGRAREGAGSLAAEQYPEIAAAMAAVEAIKGKEYEVTLKDGTTTKVVFQPFWRTVKATETEEGKVTV